MTARKSISRAFTVETIEDGVVYEIQTSVDSITIPANSSQASASGSASFYEKVGSADKTAFTAYYSVYYRTGSTYSRIRSSYANNIPSVVSYTVTSSMNAVVIYLFQSSYTGDSPESQSYIAKKEIIVIKQGDTGQRGKMSRNPYYAGTWSQLANTTFSATDYSTPYVDVLTGTATAPNCYVYIGDNGEGISYPATPSAYASSSDWELMISDYKYLITQAIFAAFAKLGSWIFNGDYMLTQHGGAGSVTTDTNYQNFDPVNLDTWIPNIMLNALNGSGHLAHGNISWDLNGNATIRGTVKADNFYHNICYVGSMGNSSGCLYSTKWGTLMDRDKFEDWLYHEAYFSAAEIVSISQRFRVGGTYDGNTLLGTVDNTDVYLYEAFVYGAGHDPSGSTSDNWYFGHGWIWNTGPADKIIIFDGVDSVELPPPDLYAGKHIEVYAIRKSGQSLHNVLLKCSSGTPYGYYYKYTPTQFIADNVFMYVRESGVVFDDIAYVNTITISTAQKATFVSVCSSDKPESEIKYGWFLQEISNINETV